MTDNEKFEAYCLIRPTDIVEDCKCGKPMIFRNFGSTDIRECGDCADKAGRVRLAVDGRMPLI